MSESRHPLLVARGDFTEEEETWMASKIYDFNTVVGRQKVKNPLGTGGPKVTAARAAGLRYRTEFAAAFPYRDPDPPAECTWDAKYDGLTVNADVWPTFGDKIYQWLQRRKAALTGLTETATTKRVRKTPHKITHEDLKDLQNPYVGNPDTVAEYSSQSSQITFEAQTPWCNVVDDELRRRQGRIYSSLQAQNELLARSAGIQVYCTAVWQHEGQVYCTDYSTTRTKSFVNTTFAQNTREEFQKYCFQSVGPSLETSVDRAGRAVQGNPSVDFRPTLPAMLERENDPLLLHESRMLETEITSLWNWQGGEGTPPWAMIQQDGETGTYALIAKERLPEGVTALRDPADWTVAERTAWSKHLRAAQEGRLAKENIFQFLQPRPGHYDVEFRREGAKNSQLKYEPDAVAFCLRQLRLMGEEEIYERDDELPIVRSDVTYDPMPAELGPVFATYIPNALSATLLAYLKEYEALGPHQANEGFWTTRSSPFPHVKRGVPAPDSGFEHFQTEKSHIRHEFFDYKGANYSNWCLGTCLSWANPVRWMHAPSGTLEGGPLGCKWPLMLLSFIQIEASRLQQGDVPVYKKKYSIEISKRDLEQIADVEEEWSKVFAQSFDRLSSTVESRRYTPPTMKESLDGQDVKLVIMQDRGRDVSQWERLGIKPVPYAPAAPTSAVDSSAAGAANTTNVTVATSASKTQRRKRESLGDTSNSKRARNTTTSDVDSSLAVNRTQAAGPSTRRAATKNKATVELKQPARAPKKQAAPSGKGKGKAKASAIEESEEDELGSEDSDDDGEEDERLKRELAADSEAESDSDGSVSGDSDEYQDSA